MGVCNSSNQKNKRPTGQKISEMTDNVEKTILECKMTRDNIKSYIKRLEKNEILRKTKAKEELKNKNRDRAKIFLSQAKLYREQIRSADGQLNMIEEQIIHIETVKQQREAVKVLENGNKVLKKLYEEVNVEKWEKIADDMNEIKVQQDEIGNFLRNHGIDQAQYDEEVDKELEMLMKQENREVELVLPEAGKNLPEVVVIDENKVDETQNVEKVERVAIAN